MAERSGNCKFFSPNYFNPTKCQNCFKPKEQHASQPEVSAATTGKQQTLGRRGSSLGRNAGPSKTVLKESILLKGRPDNDGEIPQNWKKGWFALFSNGEFQEYELVDGKAKKDNVLSSMMLQEFIRMLDGKIELGETLCFGVKTLRDTFYFKTMTKVDYENWWKEFSSFVAAPIRRTTSTASALRSNAGNYSKPKVQKQLSMPAAAHLTASNRHSRSSSISSVQSDSDRQQMESLRNQVAKLEEENTKLSKTEDQRRKLELEVNYWKEYVTNSQAFKRAGACVDTVSELAESRQEFLKLQDEYNETQKKLKMNSGKLLMQNKELSMTKEKLQEANSIIAVHKAKIEQLNKDLSSHKEQKELPKGLIIPAASNELFFNGENEKPSSSPESVTRPSAADVLSSDAQHLEDKFLVLKDRLKRIERELFLKSKELEKANESRSKVAKYTRSLLQELETRLSDNQRKLNETEGKLKNATAELAIERERRIKLEEGPRRRMSSVIAPPKSQSGDSSSSFDSQTPPSDLSEHDADTKYADYYRSRFKEAESSLLEKDKKLHQVEEKVKELQHAMKSNSDSYKVINDLQCKLSDATHKLSDRQLKIHELTREIDRLKEFEKTYTKKSKRCETLEDIVKDLEKTNADQSKALHQVKQELEMIKIREVVLKEQLQTFAEDSDNSEDEDEEHDLQLGKSIDLKNKIECMIELEALSKKLTIDNEKLNAKNTELEARVKHLNMESFKSIEAKKALGSIESLITNSEKLDYEKKIKELEQKLSEAEEKYCNEVTNLKDKQYGEMGELEKKFKDDTKQMKDDLKKAEGEIENFLRERNENEDNFNELRGRFSMAEIKIVDMQESLNEEINARKNAEALLNERSSLLSEMEERCKRVTSERDSLKEGQSSKRSSYASVDDDGDERYDLLHTENHGLKVKIRQLERQLRLSSEKFEDVMSSLREKGSLLDSGKHDRDSGIVITQEIKSIIDSYNIDTSDSSKPLLRKESDDIFVTPKSSMSSEPETVEQYKKLCSSYEKQVKDLGKRLLDSEEKVIELAEELEQQNNTEDDYISKYNTLVVRIEDLQTQIMESQESLQSKADELERERKNVINLVEVTSAYIKELEGSLAESKGKVQELQNVIELNRGGDRPQPEGSAGVQEDEDANKGTAPSEQKLTAKILMLQSDISELKASHQNELERVRAEAQKEVDSLRRRSFSAGVSEESEDLVMQVQKLEEELQKQQEIYEKDVTLLQNQFQAELKTAFNGDNSSMDMLNRIQDLEMEIEETRKECDLKVKECQDNFDREKEQMKDDMAIVLQATLAAGDFGSSQEPQAESSLLEERIIILEQELIDNKQQYEEELEMEKEAHRTEMEDTIRDMMILRDATNSSRYDDNDESDSGGSRSSFRDVDSKFKKTVSVDEIENLRQEYEEKLDLQAEEHEEELIQVRQDMAIVISSLKQGNYSDTILDLQARIKELETEIEDLNSGFKKEKSSYELKLKRADSANFFALRRNEEMGSKIYQMQIELEEIDRKHQIELQAYIDKLGVDDGNNVNETLKINEELQEKNRDLEKALEELRSSRDDEMEAFSMQLRTEKREAIEDMTDKVLKLEALIDDMKERHEQDIKQYERVNRSENMEAAAKESERIKELEIVCENLKEEYEEEIEELSKEHKKEVEKLRVFYEKEIGDIKKRSSSDVDGTSPASRKSSVDQSTVTRQLKEQKEKHEKEIEHLKSKHVEEKELLMQAQQKDVEDIRQQYDEKLKMSYKEGLRRHSVSERKSDATKMRELISEKDAVQSRLLDFEIKYDTDTKELKDKIQLLQKVVSDLKGGYDQGSSSVELSQQTLDTLSENENLLEDESQKKLKEIQEQIERYERRIEYYREKSQREKTEESHRVSELQSEIVDLHQEINDIKQTKRKEVYEKEKKEKSPHHKSLPRRNTDGSTSARRHTDSDAVKTRLRERDPKKRWSNLEERSEKDEGKSGTVLARKTLWENITVDDASKTKSLLSKTQSVK